MESYDEAEVIQGHSYENYRSSMIADLTVDLRDSLRAIFEVARTIDGIGHPQAVPEIYQRLHGQDTIA